MNLASGSKLTAWVDFGKEFPSIRFCLHSMITVSQDGDDNGSRRGGVLVIMLNVT